MLYVHVGEPSSATEFSATREGHALRYSPEGKLVGLSLLSPRELLDLDGEVRLTFPDGHVLALGRQELEPALTAAAGV